MPPLPVADALASVERLLPNRRVFGVGSAWAAYMYGKDLAYHDVDCFTPSIVSLATTVQTFLDNGAVPLEGFERTFDRWEEYDVGSWHTNSWRGQLVDGTEVNVVYKLEQKHPTRTLAQVLEGFDFGHLMHGYDYHSGRYLDLRSYHFLDIWLRNRNGAYPMNPLKREKWVQGYFSEWVGDREPGRYATNMERDYDMSLVKPDFRLGYLMASDYYLRKASRKQGEDAERAEFRAEHYANIADAIEHDDVVALSMLSDEVQEAELLPQDLIMEDLK